MKTLTSLMLIELAKTDIVMSWAVKNNRPDVYTEYMNERWGIISDLKNYKPLTDRQYANLTIY